MVESVYEGPGNNSHVSEIWTLANSLLPQTYSVQGASSLLGYQMREGNEYPGPSPFVFH